MHLSEQQHVAIALRKLERLRKLEAFDPAHIESKPTPAQAEFISEFGRIPIQIFQGGNQSGKTATCSYCVGKLSVGTLPGFSRPASWSEEPLLGLIVGRTGKQIEDSLLPRIESHLAASSVGYKVVRIGNIVQRIELENGNRIVFQSLENHSVARERLQSYTAHWVWCDELPPTMDLVRELLVRTQAKGGFNLFSFTPTVVALEIQRWVESLAIPYGRVYRVNMLDNPVYADPIRKQELVERYAHLSDEQKAMVFSGSWLSGDSLVYHFDWSKHVQFPEGYSPLWRHLEAVDPAISSALGYLLLAEKPDTGDWFVIQAEYVKGLSTPKEYVEAVIRHSNGKNITRRVSDYAPWFVNTAASPDYRRSYLTIESKNLGRKESLIAGLQGALGSRLYVSPNCDKLIAEFQECRWSDRSEGKIVHGSRFHLIDALQYAIDALPKQEKKAPQYGSVDAHIYAAHMKRKEIAFRKEQAAESRKMRLVQRKRASRWS